MANDIFSLVGPIICIALFLLIGGEIGKSESASIGTLLSYNVSMYFGGGKTSTMCSSCDKTNDNFYYQKRSLSDNNNENNEDNDQEDFEQYILEEKRRQTKSPTPATTQMKPRTTSPQTTTTRLIEDDFACSVDGVGRWENGTKRFMDPLDVSRGKFVLTQITVFLYGQFNCRSTWDSPDTHFVLFLGDTPIMERSQDTKPCVCFCKEVITYSTPELTDGFPSYSYKDWNTVRFLVTNNMICINKIQLQLTFAQSEPITSPALSVKDWIVAASVVTITILGIACIIWGLRNYQRPNHRYELVPDMESSPDSQSGNNGTPGTDGRGQYKHVFQIKGTEISLGPRIGKGSYGEVYRARWRGIDVAVKKLPYYLIENKEFMRDFNQEASIMSALRHPNVLQFLGSTMIDNDICILTEYMSRSSLYRLLHDETFDLSYPMIKRFATDTSRGMLYLHKSNPVILHRDLKSHNLLVDDAYKVKISDFGLSKVVEHCNKTMTSCGTAAWAAPEILKNARYTEKADVYSFGVCLWEFWTRKDPYEGMPTFQIIFAVGTEGLRPVVPDACPPDYAQLIRDCWDADPTKRPSFDEILMRLGSLESPEFGSAMHGSSTALRTPQATNKPATSGQSEFYKNNIN